MTPPPAPRLRVAAGVAVSTHPQARRLPGPRSAHQVSVADPPEVVSGSVLAQLGPALLLRRHASPAAVPL